MEWWVSLLSINKIKSFGYALFYYTERGNVYEENDSIVTGAQYMPFSVGL